MDSSSKMGAKLAQKRARKMLGRVGQFGGGDFPVIMAPAAPQTGLKGGPVQTSAKVRKWPLLRSAKVGTGPLFGMLGRVVCWNVCTGQLLVPRPPPQFGRPTPLTFLGVDPCKHPAPWRGPNIRSRFAKGLHGSTTRRCLYGSTSGISCDFGPFRAISGHFWHSDVGTCRLRANVCTGLLFFARPSGAGPTSGLR